MCYRCPEKTLHLRLLISSSVDKQSLIGLGLIAVILGVWLYFSGPSKEQIARNKRIRDSVELAQKTLETKEAIRIAQQTKEIDSPKPIVQVSDSAKQVELNDTYRDFAPATKGNSEYITIGNDLVTARINSKGAFIDQVQLKEYNRSGETTPLTLFDADSTKFALKLSAYDRSRIFSTDSFYFKTVSKTADAVVLRLETAKPGSHIDFSYSIKPGEYTVKSSVRFVGMQNILSQTEDQVQLNWSMLYPGQEEHIALEKKAATVYYLQTNTDVDYINPMKDEEKELSDADIKWVSFKQQFFNSSIIADKQFNRGGSFVKLGQRPQSANYVSAVSSDLGVPFGHTADESFNYQFYFGPNHYYTLKKYDAGLEQIIPMGWSIFSYINKWLVIPLFNWLNFFNMGVVILILTVVVKIVLLPIAYKTYMSGARMRVLKPETDALTAKFEKNPDPMKKQQEQMALYRKAGVNPLSGCLPLLLQFPLLIALFSFVPAAIELRQAHFMWASDLSTYDSVWTFGYVPFVNWAYGDHISLFAMLMFVSTLVYTYMNSSMMPQQGSAQMPGMKFMMYFMPVIFLAVMNTYAAGLSWYYFLANMFTFLQNWIFKKVISDKKIRAQLEANMKKPVKVSSFQKRLEDMAKQRQQPVRRK
jgi:YidC/Oxa1 family membrane protein insertase